MIQPKADSCEDTCWALLWSYVSLWVSNKSEFLWRHLFDLSVKLCKFTSFKKKRMLMKTFFRSQFKVPKVYEFQTKANSYEDICWVSAWSSLNLRVSNKSEFLWRHLLNLILKLCRFMSFKKNEFLWKRLFTLSLKLYKFLSCKQKRILLKTFVESQFEVM